MFFKRTPSGLAARARLIKDAHTTWHKDASEAEDGLNAQLAVLAQKAHGLNAMRREFSSIAIAQERE